MARGFGGLGLPNGLLLRFSENKARHGGGATPQTQRP
jgi:hypothetical protein